jgi:hypothetical protein
MAFYYNIKQDKSFNCIICSKNINNVINENQEFRCRGCNNNLCSNDPASQYQTQKIIQNTVRVKSSLYSMNLAALNVYQKPNYLPQIVDISGTNYISGGNVNWNQMSDRKEPHIQNVKTASGSTYGASSTKSSVVRLRPGSMSPGGVGVDIKHNSYERYLNRIKGKAPLRRGVIPANYGSPYIPFNRAYPIYGGKIMKTSIVNNCNCPIESNKDDLLYKNSAIQDNIYKVTYKFNVGDFVWAKKIITDTKWYKAQIISVTDNDYFIEFLDDNMKINTNVSNLHIYYDCPDYSCYDETIKSINIPIVGDVIEAGCTIFQNLSNTQIL